MSHNVYRGEGAQMPFVELLEQRIRQHVSTYEGDCVKVKLSGDGAKMTRSCNFILLSFALVDSTQDVMAAKGNHTIAVARQTSCKAFCSQMVKKQ